MPRHARWVRVSHWILALAVLTLAFTGVEILMVHPRLYWGEAGNDLTPALLELPISRNYKHRGYTPPTRFDAAAGTVSASRTYDIFNQNGWGRSLHFLAAWMLVIPGAIYLLLGLAAGHFRARVWPRPAELAPGSLRRELAEHARLRVPPFDAAAPYGALQKLAYSFVVFVAAPLMLVSGLTMAPAVTAALPFLLRLFGGYQSARTIHFASFVVLLLFVLVHVLMVVRSGFRLQMRAMTVGE
jgi:thiosulfate reductase cytochrome b subunit